MEQEEQCCWLIPPILSVILNTEIDYLTSCSDSMMVKPFLFCAWRGQYTQAPFREHAPNARLRGDSGYILVLTTWCSCCEHFNSSLPLWFECLAGEGLPHLFQLKWNWFMCPKPKAQKYIIFFCKHASHRSIWTASEVKEDYGSMDNLEDIRVKELRKVAELLVIW